MSSSRGQRIESFLPPAGRESGAPGSRTLSDSWSLWAQSSLLDSGRPSFAGDIRKLVLEREIPLIASLNIDARGPAPRSLLQADSQLRSMSWTADSADVNRSAAAAQLQAMGPIGDFKPLSQYRKAMDAGRAHGWQCLAYSLFFQLYSIPLRQALVYYAMQYREVSPEAFRTHLPDWSGEVVEAVNAVLPRAGGGGEDSFSFSPRIL